MAGYASLEKIIYELDRLDSYGQLTLDFMTDYKYNGFEIIGGHILQLNFDGTSDWCYAFIIPDPDMPFYKNNLDEYPVYLILFDVGTIEYSAPNYRAWIVKKLPTNQQDIINLLSTKTQPQPFPKLRWLEPKPWIPSIEGNDVENENATVPSWHFALPEINQSDTHCPFPDVVPCGPCKSQ